MNDKKIISFDLDGTLVDPEFNMYVWGHGIPELYAATHNMDLQKATECVLKEYDCVGDGCIEWYDIGHWFQSLGLNGNPGELMHRFRDKIQAYPEARSVVENLSTRYDLVITSNAARAFLEMELMHSDLYHYFKQTFSATSDFKEVKKTPEFYQKVCELIGVAPHEVIHVGDHWEFDYAVPSKVGMCCFFLDRAGTCEGESVVRNLKELEQRIA
jgi:HAD superfamily hydrolase (TIGR01549 family)